MNITTLISIMAVVFLIVGAFFVSAQFSVSKFSESLRFRNLAWEESTEIEPLCEEVVQGNCGGGCGGE